MKQRWIFLVFAVIAVAVLLVVAFWPGEKEPVYHGRKLSEWLAEQDQVGKRSPAAITAVGTNALPMLASWLRCEPPLFTGRIVALSAKHPTWIGAHFVSSRWGQAARDDRRRWAALSFFLLREDAGLAARHLCSVARSCSNPQHSLAVLSALGCIGKPGLPALVEIAGDKRRPDRAVALGEIYRFADRFGTNGASAIPTVAQYLQETNVDLQIVAAKTMGRLRMRPDIAVPALAPMLRSPHEGVRLAAMEALVEFRHHARPALAAVREAVADPNASVRAAAEVGLEVMAWEDGAL